LQQVVQSESDVYWEDALLAPFSGAERDQVAAFVQDATLDFGD
jgi:hypothetical protein